MVLVQNELLVSEHW